MLRLKIRFAGDYPLNEMKDGAICIITKWPDQQYLGLLVQRIDIALYPLNGKPGNVWGSIFSGLAILPDNMYRVRNVRPGDVFEDS